MSYVATNRLVQNLGEGHDTIVTSWRDQWIETLKVIHMHAHACMPKLIQELISLAISEHRVSVGE